MENKLHGLSKDIIPLFDPIEWELKLKNVNELINNKNKNVEEFINNPKFSDFTQSIYNELRGSLESKLVRLNDTDKQKLETEFKTNLKSNISNKYKELQELLSNSFSKLIQKQNANKYLTDIIDRDENIKRACMGSLYKIYSSYLHYKMLEGLVSLLSDTNNFDHGVSIIKTLKRTNPNNQLPEPVFSYSHKILSDKDKINELKTIGKHLLEQKIILQNFNYFQQTESFELLYKDIITIRKKIYIESKPEDEVKSVSRALGDKPIGLLTKIYLSFVQDFFILYVKGSGALYLLFTSDETHKTMVQPAQEKGDLFDITKSSECFVKKNNVEISLSEYFKSLNLGNSDWDLNLCINPGLYEHLYDKFILIYQFILDWNRKQLYICRNEYFLNNPNIINLINDFFKQVNYDYLTELSNSMVENGDRLIQEDGSILISQDEVGIAFIQKQELDSTIYRIVSEEDIENNEQLKKEHIGKSYNVPWLGSEPDETDSELSLEDIIMKKKTYQDVKKYIKELSSENSSTSIKYAFDNNQLGLGLDSNIGRTFYIQYNDSIDAFGLLRLSFLGVNTIKNKINSSTTGAGELLDISFIKDYNEMKSDWEHRDLLINDERIPLLDYWDIIMDLQITIRDNVRNGDTKKISKRLDRLEYLQSILCCKSNIEKNIALMANYYSKNKDNCRDNCYWNDEQLLMFSNSDDRRIKKFGLLLTKLKQVDDHFFYYPYNSDIKNYITYQLKQLKNSEPSQQNINENVINFTKSKIEEINVSTRYNSKLNFISNKIQNEHNLSPYISNLISKLYGYCSNNLNKNKQTGDDNKLSATTLLNYFGPRDQTFKIPNKKDYLQILGIYLMHLNNYKKNIYFLIDQIFLGKNNTTNRQNFTMFLDSITSALDHITGNYFGFTWIIYRKDNIPLISKQRLYDADGKPIIRPYIDGLVISQTSNGEPCFFTSLILDYYINIYEQLLMILLTKDINSSTYIEFNNETSNIFFQDIFTNMITDMHILEFMVKCKSLNTDTNISINTLDKQFFEMYSDNPINQITFIPQLRNNPFYNRSVERLSIYNKPLLSFFNSKASTAITTIVHDHIPQLSDLLKNENPGMAILNHLVETGTILNGEINQLFIDITNKKEINDIINNESNILFNSLSFDYNEVISTHTTYLNTTYLIAFLCQITNDFFAYNPVFIYFICKITDSIEVQTPANNNVIKRIYTETIDSNGNTNILLWKNDFKYYLFNIMNDNYEFYTDNNGNMISKYKIFYYCCDVLNQLYYKTFFPISRLFNRVGTDTEYQLVEYELTRNYLDFSITDIANKEYYYSQLREMINYYFQNSYLNDDTKTILINEAHNIFLGIKQQIDKEKEQIPISSTNTTTQSYPDFQQIIQQQQQQYQEQQQQIFQQQYYNYLLPPYNKQLEYEHELYRHPYASTLFRNGHTIFLLSDPDLILSLLYLEIRNPEYKHLYQRMVEVDTRLKQIAQFLFQYVASNVFTLDNYKGIYTVITPLEIEGDNLRSTITGTSKNRNYDAKTLYTTRYNEVNQHINYLSQLYGQNPNPIYVRNAQSLQQRKQEIETEFFTRYKRNITGGKKNENIKTQSGGEGLIDYTNDFIGKILWDIILSRLNIESGNPPLISIPTAKNITEAFKYREEKNNGNTILNEHVVDYIIDSTVNIKIDYTMNISMYKEPSYLFLNSMKSYITSQIKLSNIIANNDINTANQFLMSYYLDVIYKLIFTDLQNSTYVSSDLLEKNIIVSVDPLTLSQNLFDSRSEYKHVNNFPVFPIEITITCNENKYYKNMLKKITKKYINNIAFLKKALLSGYDETLYNYIIYIVNILNIDFTHSEFTTSKLNNLEEINRKSPFYKGFYYRKHNNNLIYNNIEIQTDYNQNMDTLKLEFYNKTTKTTNGEYLKMGTIIISSSDNLYKYGLEGDNKMISTNIIGIPILYDTGVFTNFLSEHGIGSDSIPSIVGMFDKTINMNNDFCSILRNINTKKLYISEYNKFYKYYKNEFTSKQLTPTRFMGSVIEVCKNEFKDKYEIYKNFIGNKLNDNIFNQWVSVIIQLIYVPVIYDKIDNQREIESLFSFLESNPNNPNRFTNIYNTALLKQYDRDVKYLQEHNFDQVRGQNKLLKVSIDNSMKKGGGSNFSTNTFNNYIIFDDKTKKLKYSDEYGDTIITNYTKNSPPIYGGNYYYYDNYAVSQSDEGITKVSIPELPLHGVELSETKLIENDENQELYELSYRVNTILAYEDNVNMFNTINKYPNKVIEIVYDNQELNIDDEDEKDNIESDIQLLGVLQSKTSINHIISNLNQKDMDIDMKLNEIVVSSGSNTIDGYYTNTIDKIDKQTLSSAINTPIQIYKRTRPDDIYIYLYAVKRDENPSNKLYYVFGNDEKAVFHSFIPTGTNLFAVDIKDACKNNFYVVDEKKDVLSEISIDDPHHGGKSHKKNTRKNKKKKCNLTKNKNKKIKKCKTKKLRKKDKKFTRSHKYYFTSYST